MSPLLLGVNIDHIATLRQCRMTRYPDPVQAAMIAESAGADSITLHLREDRRHIQEGDVRQLKKMKQTPMNLEMAMTGPMIDFALEIRPEYCCLVPEKRQELTTEGGLDVAGRVRRVRQVCRQLMDAGIRVSLFIDAEPEQISAAADCGAGVIEIHTGHYASAGEEQEQQMALDKIYRGVAQAVRAGLQVNAGHGLHYHNVQAIARIVDIHEVNIGHAIIARALFTGLSNAIGEMKQLLREART